MGTEFSKMRNQVLSIVKNTKVTHVSIEIFSTNIYVAEAQRQF